MQREYLPPMLTPFGRLMKRAKWTPGDVRSICQVDQKTVWNWRTGKTPPKAQNIADMLAALNRAGIPGAFADFLPKDRSAA